MQCHQVRIQISAYLDNELDVSSRISLELHLRQCADCHGILAELQQLDDGLRALPRIDMGRDFSKRMLLLANQQDALDSDELSQRTSALKSRSRLGGGLRALFGLASRPVAGPLDEFSDCFPLSISSAYFTIFDQLEG
jgi:anti-sigma factor RsiW